MNQEEIKKLLPHRDAMLLMTKQNCGTVLHTAEKKSAGTNGFCRDISPKTLLYPV